jgi:hypothetical protein
MSRLDSVAEGNYLVVFYHEANKILEGLGKVISITIMNEEGEKAYKVEGFREMPYGSAPAFFSETYRNKQDPKFTVVSEHEAQMWLQTHKVKETLGKQAMVAKTVLDAAELAGMRYQNLFEDDKQEVIEYAIPKGSPTVGGADLDDEIPF